MEKSSSNTFQNIYFCTRTQKYIWISIWIFFFIFVIFHFNGAPTKNMFFLFSDTAVVVVIKSGKSCSVGSFSTMLLWHCVYQIKMTRLWTLFWTHLHGKQVYECNELLLAPLQLLMEANIILVLQAKNIFKKKGKGKPILIQSLPFNGGH